MKPYIAIRNWVDHVLRGSGIRFERALIPAFVPAAVFAFDQSSFTWAMFGAWFVAWNVFVLWRWWAVLRVEARKHDEKYDRDGKFRLSKEYWDTESATAASERKRNG